MSEAEEPLVTPAQREADFAPHDQAIPAWVAAELPAAYAEVAERIAALRVEALKYEGVAQALWRVGEPLVLAVRELFTALKFETRLTGDESRRGVLVDLDADRRLLVVVAGGTDQIDRKSPSITELLRMLQDDAREGDRLVLAVNAYCDRPPEARRDDPVAQDALKLVHRLGANVIATPTLFGLWKYAFVDADAARQSVFRLHGQDGGIFK